MDIIRHRKRQMIQRKPYFCSFGEVLPIGSKRWIDVQFAYGKAGWREDIRQPNGRINVDFFVVGGEVGGEKTCTSSRGAIDDIDGNVL